MSGVVSFLDIFTVELIFKDLLVDFREPLSGFLLGILGSTLKDFDCSAIIFETTSTCFFCSSCGDFFGEFSGEDLFGRGWLDFTEELKLGFDFL